MREPFFDAFVSEFGEATTRVEATSEQIEAYRGVLPDELLTVWADEGFSGYANGLLWLVDPAKYASVLAEWLEGTELEQIDTYHVVALSAFGQMRVWGEQNNQTFNISTALHSVSVSSELLRQELAPRVAVKIFFRLLSKKPLLWERPNGGDLFAAARQAHGDLEPGQVYGFEPALRVGGAPDVDHIQRVRVDVHVSILRQLGPPKLLEFD